MKKIVLFIAITIFFGTKSFAQSPAMDSATAVAMYQHIALQYPYHGIQYVLEKTKTETIDKKDKTEYLAMVRDQAGAITWVPTTIRVGEKYLEFDGKYYFNVTQNAFIAKVEKPKPVKVKQRNQGFPGIAPDGMPGWRTN